MQQHGQPEAVQAADQIEDAMAELLEAISSEPVPQRITALAQQLREILLVRDASRDVEATTTLCRR